MMKSSLRSILSLVLIVVVVSCATMTITSAGNLRKGMTVQEAKKSLSIPPKYEFPITIGENSENVQICIYPLSSGSYVSNYILAFRNDQLLYWGYPHEFLRSADKLINEIGEKAAQEIEKLDKEKGNKPR